MLMEHHFPGKWKLASIVIIMAITTWITQGEEYPMTPTNQPQHEIAIFAGGCFWCMQPPYDDLKGVIDTRVGYIGGEVKNPAYKDVSKGITGHTEAVEITFDPTKISYKDLLHVFWRNIDPTTLNQQFADVGTQYRTGVFYLNESQKQDAIESKKELEKTGKFKKEIVTEITQATTFYPAEQEHQEFYKKHPLRYQSYKYGSGRAYYLDKKWKESK